MKILSTLIISATLGLTFTSCSEKQEPLNQEQNFVSASDSKLVNEQAIGLQDGRLVFKTAESFTQVLNKHSDPDYVAAFKRIVTKKGLYTTGSFNKYLGDDNKDLLKLFILNRDGIFQLKDKIYKVDFVNREYRLLDVKNSNELPLLLHNNNSPNIKVYRFEDVSTSRNLALATNSTITVKSLKNGVTTQSIDYPDAFACTYCGLGIIAFVAGAVPAGLLEAVACYQCYNSLQ